MAPRHSLDITILRTASSFMGQPLIFRFCSNCGHWQELKERTFALQSPDSRLTSYTPMVTWL